VQTDGTFYHFESGDYHQIMKWKGSKQSSASRILDVVVHQ